MPSIGFPPPSLERAAHVGGPAEHAVLVDHRPVGRSAFGPFRKYSETEKRFGFAQCLRMAE